MDRKRLVEVQEDLNLVFPNGGYTLTVQDGEPALRLTWDKSVHPNLRRFSMELLRLHDIQFETGDLRH